MRQWYSLFLLVVALVVLPGTARAVNIGTLHCNDPSGNNLAIGQTVTVTGVVTEIANTAYNFRFYVQDATGGIAVFGAYMSTTYATCPNMGDLLTVTGTITSYNGLTELSPFLTFVRSSTGNPDPPAPRLTPAEANAAYQADDCDPYEGLLVRVSCCYVRLSTGETPGPGQTFTSGNYRLVDANDPASSITLYISPTASTLVCPWPNPIIGQPIPTGPVSVVGVLAQFDSTSPYTTGYELIPRSIMDFIACGACCSPGYVATAYCQTLTQGDCGADGGTWVPGAQCPNTCAVVPVRNTTWGRIKTLYR